MTTAVPALKPVVYGPTWTRTNDGWLLPRYSLGWEAIDWAQDWLMHPDGASMDQGWTFTDEQARFVLWWYATDEQGRFLKRIGMLRRMKGWGKDPLAAVLACIEFIGPCRYAGYFHTSGDYAGQPAAVERESAWIQIAASSKDQTKNTMTLFPALLRKCDDSPQFDLDVGKEIIYAYGSSRRIESVTSSPRSLEGGRSTFTIKNEALALDTAIPTPDGWKTVGEIQPGDRVYGSTGLTEVVNVTPIYELRPCYRVRFEDGTSVVCDEGHLWRAKPVSSAASPRTWTTQQLAEDGRAFAVPLRDSFEEVDTNLLLDPYLLGYWLGDGDSRAALLSVGEIDRWPLINELEQRGFAVKECQVGHGRAAKLSIRIPDARRNRNDPRPLGVRGRLEALGVLRNKHIPTAYLRSSRAQRLDLLRGLMDSDGCITAAQSQAIFVNQNRRLAEGVVELARSLGYRVSIVETVDQRWERPRQGWRVVFRADEDLNPFLLRRKAVGVTGRRRQWKTITHIERVPSVPVRCIEVDASDHLFVAGDGWTLTHNTHHWLRSNEGDQMSKVIARNAAKSSDGASRVLAISNAHEPGEMSDAELDYNAWLSLLAKGDALDSDFLYDSIEAPADVDLKDDDALRQAIEICRGDSKWLNIDRLIAEIRSPRTEEAEARRFYLNQLWASEDRAFDVEAWNLHGDSQYRPPKGARISLGGDGSKNFDHTAIVATELATGFQWLAGYWEPRLDGETGELSIPVDEVEAAVEALFEDYDVWRFYFDPFGWREQLDRWRGRYNTASDRVIPWDTTQYKRMSIALLDYRAAIDQGELGHDADSRFTAAIRNARKRTQAYTDDNGERMWTITKEHPNSPNKIDAAMAGCMSWKARNDAIALGALLPKPGLQIFISGA